METRMFLGLMAVLAGFACLFGAAWAIAAEARTRWAAIAAQGQTPSLGALAQWRLQNGFGALKPLAATLLHVERIGQFADDLQETCEDRGVPAGAQPLLTVAIAALLALCGVSALLTGSVVGAIAVPACAAVLLASAVGNERDKRREAVRDAVPAALESMSACFGSGFTLLQTFRQVGNDVPGALGVTFKRSAAVLETGGSANAALAELREGAHASELAFVAVALDVQHQSGGAMRQVLDAATDTVKGELALRRSLRVQTAQAKLSARVVTVMPFILVAAFSLASPDFLSPFFSSIAGYALLALALTMQVSGVVLVRRALAVEGVS